MIRRDDGSREKWYRAGELLAWSAIFTVALTQQPLYSDNQNTKFLQGLAAAGTGTLNKDWLAHTFDPFPVFTWIVYAVSSLGWPLLFHVLMVPLVAAYLYGLLAVARLVWGDAETATKRRVVLAGLVFAHSMLFSHFIGFFTRWRMAWMPTGVAHQYIVNTIFQPCTFGALLLLSMALFVKRRPVWTGVCLAAASVLHPTYLISSILLLLVYSAWLAREARYRDIAKLALATVIVAAPQFIYVGINLVPTTAEQAIEANRILAEERIPHHSLPSFWFDASAATKLVLCIVGIALLRRTVVGWALAAGFTVAVVSAIAVEITHSNGTALVAPWRVSVWMVPVALAALLAWGVGLVFDHVVAARAYLRQAAAATVAVGVCLTFAAGVYHQTRVAAKSEDALGLGAITFARDTRLPEDHYLVPPKLNNFRVNSGVPTLVTRKSHPIKDVEVLEWNRRLVAAERFYEAKEEHQAAAALREIEQTYGVTHVVAPLKGAAQNVLRQAGEPVYVDDEYQVFRLAPARLAKLGEAPAAAPVTPPAN